MIKQKNIASVYHLGVLLPRKHAVLQVAIENSLEGCQCLVDFDKHCFLTCPSDSVEVQHTYDASTKSNNGFAKPRSAAFG